MEKLDSWVLGEQSARVRGLCRNPGEDRTSDTRESDFCVDLEWENFDSHAYNTDMIEIDIELEDDNPVEKHLAVTTDSEMQTAEVIKTLTISVAKNHYIKCDTKKVGPI